MYGMYRKNFIAVRIALAIDGVIKNVKKANDIDAKRALIANAVCQQILLSTLLTVKSVWDIVL